MRFGVYGPFELPRKRGLIDTTAKVKREFWSLVEARVPGLSEACGCYIYVVSARNGALPWYVGRTTQRSFKLEAIGSFQVNHYNRAIAGKVGVKPQLYFLAKKTPRDHFAKPSRNSHSDIKFLEKFMFGIALERNPDLYNSRNTKFLNNLVVPGVINTPQGAPTTDERSLRDALGL